MMEPQWSPPFHRRVTRGETKEGYHGPTAAMEPAVSPAGDPVPDRGGDQACSRPQWSPPFHRRVTACGAGGRVRGGRPPQWSPPFHRRVTTRSSG